MFQELQQPLFSRSNKIKHSEFNNWSLSESSLKNESKPSIKDFWNFCTVPVYDVTSPKPLRPYKLFRLKTA